MANPFSESAKKITDAQEKAISDAEFAKGMTSAAGTSTKRVKTPELAKTAKRVEGSVQDMRNAAANAENIRRGKAQIAKRKQTAEAVRVADKLGAKAGISKPVRDAATKPYRK